MNPNLTLTGDAPMERTGYPSVGPMPSESDEIAAGLNNHDHTAMPGGAGEGPNVDEASDFPPASVGSGSAVDNADSWPATNSASAADTPAYGQTPGRRSCRKDKSLPGINPEAFSLKSETMEIPIEQLRAPRETRS